MSLGWLYAKFADARNAHFDDGRNRIADLGARVISVGNITTGGTGKTPLVILISEALAARGKRVCVLTRGYGRKNANERVVVSDGRRLLVGVTDAGDEPFEIARKLLGKAVVIADPDRTAAGKFAKDNFGISTFVLDDGFQHRQIKRDLDIVCIDAVDPFCGGRMLPFGRLRESPSGLRRANAIVITRADLAGDLNETRSEIAMHAPDIPVFTTRTKMSGMTLIDRFNASADDTMPSNGIDLGALAHSSAFAFCGLGNPKAFFGQLERDNFEIAGQRAFADHFRYRQKDLDRLAAEARNGGAAYLLTTAKDAVKLGQLRISMPCFVVESDLVLDEMTAFTALL